MLNKVLDVAIKEDASDIHLVPGIKPYLRVKRQLVELIDFPMVGKEDTQFAFEEITGKNKFKNDIFQSERKLDTSFEYKDIKFRVNISLSNNAIVITMRLIKDILPTFEELGLPLVLKSLLNQSQGLILVTGKTNSGKSTTLNVMIDRINQTQEKKIITLENPIEFVHHSNKSIIVQKQIGLQEDARNFSEGVKNALREDADILVIGEIRDKETMDTAIEMAESGHLVVGTIHTKSCAETIDRIINFYDIEQHINIKYLMSTLLRAIISQKLIRGTDNSLVLIPEVMIIDSVMAGSIRKEKFSISEIEDLIQVGADKGNIGYLYSFAKAYVEGKLNLDIIKNYIEEKNYETLNRIIMQLKVKNKE